MAALTTDSEPGNAEPRFYGIRHHSPRCARLLRQALEANPPQAIVLEAPAELEGVTQWVRNPALCPPVAILVYEKDDPAAASYYPLVEFSPEWQVLKFAAEHAIPVFMMDLPYAYRESSRKTGDEPTHDDDAEAAERFQLELDLPGGSPEAGELGEQSATREELLEDPLGTLARLAGYSDPEAWWEAHFELQRDAQNTDAAGGHVEGVFHLISETIHALRERDFSAENIVGWSKAQGEKLRNLRREAHMRKILRGVVNGGAQNVAVVCGAWHIPALQCSVPVKVDNTLLKGLKRTKMLATWVPWTYRNLASTGGYAAGMKSPAYYEHLWQYPESPAIPWLSRAGRLLRGKDLEASAAQAVDAARLAVQLAGLRGNAVAGLDELHEAALCVLGEGRETHLAGVRDLLIIGDRIGSVPPEIPATPLQQDFRNACRKLKLKPQQEPVPKDFDLRTPTGVPRSQFLHRLLILGVNWGKPVQDRRRDLGSFHERWILAWRPHYEVQLITAGQWGSTINAAATTRAIEHAEAAENLEEIVRLLEKVLQADLPEAFEPVLRRLESVAAVQSEFGALLAVIPPLSEVATYGDVRQTRQWRVRQILEHTVARALVGMDSGCRNLDDEFAREITYKLVAATFALRSGEWPRLRNSWTEGLLQLLNAPDTAGFLQGRLTRLLLQQQNLSTEETQRRLSQALSPGIEPQLASLWLEGFLQGSGLILLHSQEIWEIINRWIATLPRAVFVDHLPLLRKAFATLNTNEKQRLAEKARVHHAAPARGVAKTETTVQGGDVVDWNRALRPLPILRQIMPSLTEIGSRKRGEGANAN